ncbi:MAG TPA: hypothetical protein VH814_26160 [Steroidobacteraceae bacterium]
MTGAIMFEVARDWNYAAAVIYAESAFNFRARELVGAESAFCFAREKIFS